MMTGAALFRVISLSGDPESTARGMKADQLFAVRAFINQHATHPHAGFPGVVNDVIDDVLAQAAAWPVGIGQGSIGSAAGSGCGEAAGSRVYGSAVLERAQGYDAALAGSLTSNRGGKNPC